VNSHPEFLTLFLSKEHEYKLTYRTHTDLFIDVFHPMLQRNGEV